MPDIRDTGRIRQALSYWDALRLRRLAAYKKSEGAAKAKAAAALSAAAFFEGVLIFSGLEPVEEASARLGWDKANGAPAGALAADAGRLFFHSVVFAIALLPIPVLQVARAAVAGNAGAIAFLLLMSAGAVNRYLLHLI